MKRIFIYREKTLYSITKEGQVFSHTIGKFLKPTITEGYCRVTLSFNSKAYTFSIHRLVALYFIPNPQQYPEVNHIDNNPSNNDVSNLEWVTPKMNSEHCVRQGRQSKGEHRPTSKFSESQVLEIRRLYQTGNFTQRDLAKKFQATQASIWGITSRKTWKHI